MKQRFYLLRPASGIYFIQDSLTGGQKATRTNMASRNAGHARPGQDTNPFDPQWKMALYQEALRIANTVIQTRPSFEAWRWVPTVSRKSRHLLPVGRADEDRSPSWGDIDSGC